MRPLTPIINSHILYLSFTLLFLSWLVPEIIWGGSVFLTWKKAILEYSFLLYFYFYFNERKWKSDVKTRNFSLQRPGLFLFQIFFFFWIKNSTFLLSGFKMKQVFLPKDCDILLYFKWKGWEQYVSSYLRTTEVRLVQ